MYVKVRHDYLFTFTFVPHAQTAPWQEAHVIWTQMLGPRPKLPGHVHGLSQVWLRHCPHTWKRKRVRVQWSGSKTIYMS